MAASKAGSRRQKGRNSFSHKKSVHGRAKRAQQRQINLDKKAAANGR